VRTRAYTARVRIQLNGQPRDLEQPTTVDDLVREIGLEASPCAVEVNARLVRRAERAAVTLCDGDRVEVVTLVGGG